MQDWGFIASIEDLVSEIPNLAYTRTVMRQLLRHFGHNEFLRIKS